MGFRLFQWNQIKSLKLSKLFTIQMVIRDVIVTTSGQNGQADHA
jgi:hypothetical protein